WKNKIEQNGVGKGYENKLVTQKSNNFERWVKVEKFTINKNYTCYSTLHNIIIYFKFFDIIFCCCVFCIFCFSCVIENFCSK
ncbi:MAG: hypothetical protein COS36_05390, partial [Candidatus Altarchaeum sp. CG03_land_8_20_14_0_80_32_618]